MHAGCGIVHSLRSTELDLRDSFQLLFAEPDHEKVYKAFGDWKVLKFEFAFLLLLALRQPARLGGPLRPTAHAPTISS